MANDMNMVILTGTVPKFKTQQALFTKNIDDENKAFATLKLSVGRRVHNRETNQWENKDDIYNVMAFRKTAQTLAKMAKPGTGLIIQAHIGPSQKIQRNGQDVLDANGHAIYSGERLIINDYNGISFMHGDSTGSSQQASTQSGGIDLNAAMQQQAQAQPAPVAAAPAAGGNGGALDFMDLDLDNI